MNVDPCPFKLINFVFLSFSIEVPSYCCGSLGHRSSDPNVEEGFGRRGGPARRRMCRLEPLKLVAQIRGDDVVRFVLHQVGDDLRSRSGHRLRPLVGQGLRDHLPREHVRDHEPTFVPPAPMKFVHS